MVDNWEFIFERLLFQSPSKNTDELTVTLATISAPFICTVLTSISRIAFDFVRKSGSLLS